MEEENSKKVFELVPLGKWKRILLFLGDFFINFILAFILFNLTVFPLAKWICNTQAKNEEAAETEVIANNLLSSSGIIFNETSETSFEQNVNYTFKVFLSYYVFDEENPSADHPQYGHKIQNEVIRTYYINIKGQEDTYLSLFNEVNFDGLFTVGATANDVVMKDEYKVLLSNELLEVTDESKYSTNMLKARDHVFARLFYLDVYKDILKNDFVKDGVSYNACMQKIKNIMTSLQWVVTVSAIIAAILSWAVIYLIWPLVNSSHRTITMSIMKQDKLQIKNLHMIDRGNVAIQSFYYFLLSLPVVIFMPMLYFGVAYTFNLPLLFILTVISIGLAIASLFFVLFNQYNRSGSDILTYTVVVPTSELDNLYRLQNNE